MKFLKCILRTIEILFGAIISALGFLLLVITLFLVTQAYAFSKPVHIGANYDNARSYVERNVRYRLLNKGQAIILKQKGTATWYCCYKKGTRTADGSLYDKRKMTAAHKTLPFGSLVEVTNVRNNKSVIVEITDRGPYKPGKIIDLTPAAFDKIQSRKLGIAEVRLKVVGFRY